jgi:hypothetical protein
MLIFSCENKSAGAAIALMAQSVTPSSQLDSSSRAMKADTTTASFKELAPKG